MAGGDLHVKPNKFIENWAARREAVEFGFRWTPKSLLTLGIVGVAIPGAVYYAMCHEFHAMADRQNKPRLHYPLYGDGK